MNSIKKFRIIILLALIFILLFQISYLFNNKIILLNNNFNSKNIINLKSFRYWNLTGSPIYIDDSDPDYNWSKTAKDNDWCNGSGTWSDPYIIENVEINSLYSGSCLSIRNSNKMFIIKNCTFFNSGIVNSAGLFLENCSYGIIKNITIKLNPNGIRVSLCNNLSIEENNIRGHYNFGINIQNSSIITILDNYVVSSENGIWITDSYDNIILQNHILSNVASGIVLNSCENTTIIKNFVDNNNVGIGLVQYSKFNNVSKNNITLSYWGLGLSPNSEYNLIYENYFINNIIHGVDDGFGNQWDNGSIGNYWDNYTGIDADDNGIGDDPYDNIFGYINISARNQDNYPIWRDGDDIAPQIKINNPNYYDLIGKKSPIFDIKITDQTLNSTWYRLWNGTKLTKNNTFEYLIDNEIEQNLWDEIGNGTVIITFFANDSIGRSSYQNVTLRKDVLNPIITINKPIENDLFGIKSPSADEFNITFEDPNSIDYKWYMLSNETYNTDNHTWNGYIEQQFWDEIFNGTVNIKIYANDSVGNIGFADISVQKDIYIPEILINYPNNNDIFSLNAPNFIVEIFDPESNLDKMWYTINYDTLKVLFTSNDTIDQGLWNATADGIVTLTFFANDTAGNINFTSVSIIKDTHFPEILIISPNSNDIFGITAPTFNIQIIEANLQEKRYSLNGRPNITFTIETQFSQTEWNQVGNGTVLITFYIIDKAGNVNSSEIIVRKDAYAPEIIINSPLNEQKFGKTPPDYNISIIEEDLVSTWYTIEGVAGTFSFTGLTGSIDRDAWDDAPKGEITITFYVVDRAGNIGSESIVVIKSIPSEPAIPSYNVFLLFGILVIVLILISKKLTNS